VGYNTVAGNTGLSSVDRRTDSIQRAKHICYMLSRAKTLLSIKLIKVAPPVYSITSS